MGYFSAGFFKIVTFIFVALSLVLALPRFSPVILPRVKAPSATYDCDDATLDMYREFQSRGIQAMPIVGNLNTDNETFDECDHVWLLVQSGDKEIAYDWGLPRFDKQHYEGYVVSLDYLLEAVAADLEGSGSTAVAQR